jgi:hypothetical protein
MSINNKAAKECLKIIWTAFDDNSNAAFQMLMQLSQVKSNQSFHDSMQLLLDLAKSQHKDLVKDE